MTTGTDSKSFKDHLEDARRVVREWPVWKQTLLGDSPVVAYDWLCTNSPSYEDLERGTVVRTTDGYIAKAVWYPQMGGYVAKCWVLYDPHSESECFDAIVFHDGDFAFEPENHGPGRELHHCNPDQFVSFGETVREFVSNVSSTPSTSEVK